MRKSMWVRQVVAWGVSCFRLAVRVIFRWLMLWCCWCRAGPDKRLVLHPHGAIHCSLRQASLQESRLQWACSGFRWQEDEQALEELSGAISGLQLEQEMLMAFALPTCVTVTFGSLVQRFRVSPALHGISISATLRCLLQLDIAAMPHKPYIEGTASIIFTIASICRIRWKWSTNMGLMR